ncbi:hypothetical protein [Streptomyces sp. NPDC017964]|uniref:hypothetical protein n=1 Tax=Streptomyces sp. NPDC017964 TaxID=3365022 RepID=UPI0037BDDCCF
MLTLAADIEVPARFGRALADPIRCRILLALRQAPACPADLDSNRVCPRALGGANVGSVTDA